MSGENPNEPTGLPQDDIDALLNAAGGQDASGAASDVPAAPAGGPPAESAGAPVEEEGSASTGSAAPSAEAGGSPPAAEGVPPGDSGPGDIDAALAGAQSAASTAAAASDAPPDAATSAASDGVVSQADVDSAIAEAASAAAGEPAPATDAPKLDTAGRPFDEAAALMEAAIAEERAAAAAMPPTPVAPPPAGAVRLDLPDFARPADAASEKGIELLNDVDLDVKIELGRAAMLIEDVLKLGEGSVIELDKLAGDPVDVLVNERLVARGEVLVLNDSFCVRISEIVPGVESADAPAAS